MIDFKILRTFLLILFIVFVQTLMSCTHDGSNPPEWNWADSTETSVSSSDSTIIAQGWVLQTHFGELPDYIRVYKSPDMIQNKKTIAYIVVADLGQSKFNVLGDASGYHTPDQFYAAQQFPVIMNGGYFWDGSSLSMLCRNFNVLSPNNQIEYRQDATVLYYPTRGAFGLMSDGTYKVNWIYTNNNVTYSYPEPAPNKSGDAPLQMPSATFPAGAKIWSAQTAIGAGPVLIKSGQIKNTFVEELFDADSGVQPEINAPRTGIGVTADNKMIFFVCEGRNMTAGVPGLTLADEAQALLDLGCIEALNLDGGGSSCLLINGHETIKPSDGKQRSVVTGVALQ